MHRRFCGRLCMGIADSIRESIEGAQTNKDMQILWLCGNPTRNTGASTSASTVPPPLALECRQPDGDRLEQGTDPAAGRRLRGKFRLRDGVFRPDANLPAGSASDERSLPHGITPGPQVEERTRLSSLSKMPRAATGPKRIRDESRERPCRKAGTTKPSAGTPGLSILQGVWR